MILLVLGLVIFLGLHSTRIFAERARSAAIARFGEGLWKGLYSLLSIVGFVLILWGFGAARWDAVVLWAPPIFFRHLALTLMLISLILLGGYFFRKSHVAVLAHHPMVWSVFFWSLAHLLANGSAADLLLFGAFFIWAGADLASAYARDRAVAKVYPTPEIGATIGAAGAGLVLYILLIGGAHLWLFGVPPFTY
jgi:uncharacterized membrane protein